MSDNEIKRAIKQLAGTDLVDTVHLVQCQVTSVDISQRTCVCNALSGKNVQVLENVQLMAEVEDGFLLVPAIDSTVIVSFSEYNPPFVVMFSAIDQVFISSDGNIQFNDGSYAGLVKVVELTGKLNALENKVNDLITKFNAHVHSGVTTGSGSSAATVTPVIGQLTPTMQSEIENEKIVHGS